MDPLLNAGPAIQLHVFAALSAFGLGVVQLALPKGGGRHKLIGWGWVIAMILTAVSSFWIHEIRLIGEWSPIHLLSIVTLINVPMAIVAIRRGNIRRHSRLMVSLFIFALLLAGGFTLLPGRVLHAVVFG